MAASRFVCALMALAAFGASFAQLDPNRTIVTINGQEVKAEEYFRRMEFLPGVGKQMGNNIATFPPGFLTIEQLITERLLLQMAREKGVLPTEVELNAEMAAKIQEDPKLLERWKLSGRSETDLREQVRLELAQFRLQTFGVTVTDQEVEAYYRENRAQFTTPKSAKLRVIVVESPGDRDLVDGDLRAGKTFAEVAKARSVDITKDLGGDYGTLPISMLNVTFRDAINQLNKGESTPWIQAGTRYVKFLVEDVVAEKLNPLDANLRRAIRRQMMNQRGMVRNRLDKDMADMRAKAKIDIKNAEFAEAYKKFVEAYLRQRG